MSQLGLLLTLLTASAGPTAASPDPKDLAVPPADVVKARGLVGKLASENFDEREDAQDDLAKMGRLALPALLHGINSHPSPEVRFRCQTLLPKAAARDLQARLDTFLADTAGKFEHDLPGWNEFRKITGATPAARGVFVELLADPSNRELVLAVAGPHTDMGTLVAARKQEMFNWRYPRSVAASTRRETKDASAADVLTLMFAESQVASKYVPRTSSSPLIYSASEFATAAADSGEKGKAYRAVVGKWVETREDAIALNTAISTATNLNLNAEAATAAGRLIQLKGATVFYRAQAAMTIAKLGAKEHLPALEGAFADESVLRSVRIAAGNQEIVQVQLRDIALAAAILLVGQEPEAFGFVEVNKASGGIRLSYANWQLPDEKRKAAFEKWKAWREKNPDGKVEEKPEKKEPTSSDLKREKYSLKQPIYIEPKKKPGRP